MQQAPPLPYRTWRSGDSLVFAGEWVVKCGRYGSIQGEREKSVWSKNPLRCGSSSVTILPVRKFVQVLVWSFCVGKSCEGFVAAKSTLLEVCQSKFQSLQFRPSNCFHADRTNDNAMSLELFPMPSLCLPMGTEGCQTVGFSV